MKRSSGVLMHVSSLWGDYSCGAFGDEAKKWIDFLSSCGFSYWQVLPFCLPDECNSPYKSYSAFSINPNFINLVSLNRSGLITNAELESARQSTPYYCEFDRLSSQRLALLGFACERFSEWDKVDQFLKDHPQVSDFCTFMALKKANGGEIWQKWTIAEPDQRELRLWSFLQYIAYTQWLSVKEYANEKGIKIIGDVPIYVALDSSDVWSSPELFQLDRDNYPTCVAGVPPDYFSEDGQLWGNPLYDWKKMKADGYRWWRSRMAFMCELFDGVRIDHFRGLESYFSIPSSETTAKNGKWIKGPGMAFIRAIKELCSDRLIIAEDLGDITPAVNKLVRDSGFPGMRVLQFAFLGDPNSPHLPHNYSDNCVCYTGTHDNNTLLGYVWESDEEVRQRLFRYVGYQSDDRDGSYESIMRTMFSSHAPLLILPVQDLLFYGSDTRLNTPGSADGNWSYRVTIEQLEKIDVTRLKSLNVTYGRA